MLPRRCSPILPQWPIDRTGHLILSSRQYGERTRQNSSSSVFSVMAPTRTNFIAGRPVPVVGAQRRVPDRTIRAEDPAVVVRAAVLVDQPVVGRDAGEARRVV